MKIYVGSSLNLIRALILELEIDSCMKLNLTFSTSLDSRMKLNLTFLTSLFVNLLNEQACELVYEFGNELSF